jgi:23S rRNA pseudouridine1911/1915/1917 synthase
MHHAGSEDSTNDSTGAQRSVRSLTVPEELTGVRIDQALARLIPELSRTEAHRLIDRGFVRVAGKPVSRSSLRLQSGDAIDVALESRPPRSSLEPERLPLDIRYEDEHLAVLHKPAGLVMHPGAGRRRGTLVARLKARYGDLPGASVRPGLVHRLDRDTSGLLVVALTPVALRRLQAQVAAREVERTYEALVWGEPRAAAGIIEVPIGRSRRDRTRMAPLRDRGRPAVSEYRVVERFGLASRLEVALRTGRTHQIRVHLQFIGHPVVGDPTYGGRPRSLVALPASERARALRLLKAIDRQALHAFRLAFAHPVTGATLCFEAERPADLARCLAILREKNPATHKDEG